MQIYKGMKFEGIEKKKHWRGGVEERKKLPGKGGFVCSSEKKKGIVPILFGRDTYSTENVGTNQKIKEGTL